MRKTPLPRLAAWLLLATCLSSWQGLVAESHPPAPPAAKLKVGDLAPDFRLQYFDGNDLKDITLGQYRGKSNVILAFYVFAFTGG
jgi:hypothetical protein